MKLIDKVGETVIACPFFLIEPDADRNKFCGILSRINTGKFGCQLRMSPKSPSKQYTKSLLPGKQRSCPAHFFACTTKKAIPVECNRAGIDGYCLFFAGSQAGAATGARGSTYPRNRGCHDADISYLRHRTGVGAERNGYPEHSVVWYFRSNGGVLRCEPCTLFE